MSRPRVYLTLLLGLTCTSPLIAQSRSIRRISEIRRLSQQLRWVDTAQSGEYERTKAVITQRLLKELDTYLGESLRPDLMTAEPVTQAMDSALEYKRGDARHNVAFFADLPTARLLVVGIEIARGGPAIPEDAVSFRAYKADGGRWNLAANSAVWESATDLYAQQLTSAPVKGQFWFLGSVIVTPSQAPPMIAIRLYAFDGVQFTMAWMPTDSRVQVCQHCVQAAEPKESFTVVPDGFVVNKLFDPTGHAPHSPNIVIHDQFVTTAGGPTKVKSWRTERR